MRIAIFSDTYDPQVNGVARTLKRLTDHMEARGVEFELFVPELGNDSRTYPNIHQHTSFPFFFYPECRTAIANPRKIEKRLREFSPDLIHLATPLTMGLYGLHAAKKLGIPMAASYHTHFDRYLDYYKMSWISPFLWKYMKWFHAECEKIFVPSIETMLHLEEQGLSNLSIWTRGVDCSMFTPSKRMLQTREKYKIQKKYLILFAGRLAPEKDLDTLISTIKGLSPSIRDEVHWMIAGNGPCYQEVQKKLQGESVTMTGYLNSKELSELYASSDLFVFPSPTETFGNVVLEAAASGIPAVVADQGGVTGIIKNHFNGLICPARSSTGFVEAVEFLITNEEARERMGRNAREFAENQSWERIFDGLLNEYEEIIEAPKDIRKHA
ncbi:glycosyltransferase family 1 protein [Rossellomorea vietnamensis]|uniref:Glycosyltransferase family 1 protein n=1 Tax=Rossellomorea vietnamensis TaxID=218284 RepID=A0A5D4MGF0_9BACI|nr:MULTISPECIES: glycosyltransferase family 1 protein [Bacillaceae]TYS00578.1 glycosyltransferase family 1 protein [Rossellomorea vietnamensis]